MSSSNFSSLEIPEEIYDTRVNLSYVFAKITYILDDAPYNYVESMSSIRSITTLLNLLSLLIKSDKKLKLSLTNYLLPRMSKIYDKIVIRSILDSIITEKWMSGSFSLSEWNIIESFIIKINSFKELTKYKIPIPKVLEILDRLQIICLQHKLSDIVEDGEEESQRQVSYIVGKRGENQFHNLYLLPVNTNEPNSSSNELLFGIEKVMHHFLFCCSKNYQILEYLSTRFLANNCNDDDNGKRRKQKFQYFKGYTDFWFNDLLNERLKQTDDDLKRIEALRDSLLDSGNDEELSVDLIGVILIMNRLIMTIRFFQKLPQQIEPVVCDDFGIISVSDIVEYVPMPIPYTETEEKSSINQLGIYKSIGIHSSGDESNFYDVKSKRSNVSIGVKKFFQFQFVRRFFRKK